MKQKIKIGNDILEVEILKKDSQSIEFKIDEKLYTFNKGKETDNYITLKESDQVFYKGADKGKFHLLGREALIIEKVSARASAHSGGDQSLISPMPGKIIDVLVKEGQEVKAGDPLVVMEAMKMEHTISAPKDGQVTKIHYAVGEQVESQVALLEVE